MNNNLKFAVRDIKQIIYNNLPQSGNLNEIHEIIANYTTGYLVNEGRFSQAAQMAANTVRSGAQHFGNIRDDLTSAALGSNTIAPTDPFWTKIAKSPNVLTARTFAWIAGIGFAIFGSFSDLFKNIFNTVTFNAFDLQTSDKVIELPSNVATASVIKDKLSQLNPNNFQNTYNELQQRLVTITDKINNTDDVGKLGTYSQELEIVKSSLIEMKEQLVKKGLSQDPNLLKSIDTFIMQAKGNQDLIGATIDKINNGLSTSDVLIEIAKYGGIVISSLALSYVLVTFLKEKFGQTTKLKMFDSRMDGYIDDLKRLGLRDLSDLQNKLLKMKEECARSSNFNYHQQNRLFINLEHSLKCYLTYNISLIAAIFVAFKENMRLLGQDVNNINSVKSIIDSKFNLPALTIMSKMYEDFKSILQELVQDNVKIGEILHQIDNIVLNSKGRGK
jgi:hypothetical protein